MDIATGVQKARRFVASLSVVTLVASLFVANVAQAATYKDVPADAWFYTYVEQLAAAGILDTTQQNYRPADLANRAEAAKLLVEAAGLTIDTSAGPSFTDVAPGAWYYQYVETAAKNGVVGGYKDAAGNLTGKFGPGDAVTREQFSKMAMNAMNLTKNTDGGPHFPDVGTDRWSYDFVETLYNWSVVDGYPDGTFGPTKNINRAEIAKMVVGAMDPVARGTAGAFNVQTATATSATMVDVMFSQDVDATAGAVAGNFKIVDSNNAALAVTAATVSGDKVTLTTASQTSNRPYTLTVSNVKSASGKSLDTDSANFNGYNPLGVGGPLTVALSDPQPVKPGEAVPKGSTGVVVGCWDFKAGSSAVVVESVTAHRVGAGSQLDLPNVYLYNDATRLTTGRTVNSETQMVEFNNVNVSIPAGGNAKLCVVVDLSLTAAANGRHAFELTDKSVTTNASSVSGSFPLVSNDISVAGGQVGTATVSANGSLDEVTIGQTQARIAQFQIEMDGSEDAELRRVALYIRGAIRPTDLTNLKLYMEGNAEALATVDAVTSNSLATFVLSKPQTIGRGQRKIFYVTSDVKGRNGDDIKTYLDETTDMLVVGKTFGFGVRVNNVTTGVFAGYDGATVGAMNGFSRVTVKGSDFNVAFTGPTAGDIAIGQQAAHCLDLTITNQSGEDVTVRDWKVRLDITNVPAANGGLINEGSANTPNYTLIKLARINSDGTLGGSLLGPAELPGLGDTSQDVTLSGSGTIHTGESVKAAVTVNLASNAAMNGDKLRCTLLNLVGLADAVRDSNGDQLTASSITPNANIAGNIMNISSSGLTFTLATTPTSQSYTRGTNDAALVGLSVTAGSSLDNTLKSVTLTAYVDHDFNGVFAAGTEGGVQANNIIDNSVALYDGSTRVSDFKNINAVDGKVVFNNLSIVVAKGQTKNLTLKGHVSNTAPFTGSRDDIKFGIGAVSDVTAIDQNGQTVATSAISVAGAANGTLGAGTVVMSVVGSGNGSVATATSPSSTALAGAQEVEVGRWTFNSVNENAMLKDMQFAVLNTSGSSISNVKLYTGSNCDVAVGSPSGYPVIAPGVVNVTDINVTVTSSASYTLCAKAMTGTVNTDGVTQPVSGSNVGLNLLNLTEVTSGSGENIAAKYAGNASANNAAKVGGAGAPFDTIDNVETSITIGAGDANEIDNSGPSTFVVPPVGTVIQIDGEMMFVTVSGPTLTVVRGFANTVASSHAAGAPVTVSTVAVRSPAGTDVAKGDVYTNAAGTGYSLCVDPSLGGTTTVCDNVADTVVPVLGTGAPFLPAASTARFPLHGNLHKLYRAVPQITNLTPVSAPAVTPSTNTVLLDFKVKAVGDQLTFASNAQASEAQATIGAVAAGAGNQIVAKLVTNGVAPAVASCRLDKVTGGTQTLATQATIASNTQYVAFRFNSNQLTVTNGGEVQLQVICDTSTMLGVTAGHQTTGSIESNAKSIEWNDNVVSDILGAGAFIFQTEMQGYSARVTT
ncbi:MAG: S-layer homology domain-containing protein [Candidatus Gracilibacteria bacterium]